MWTRLSMLLPLLLYFSLDKEPNPQLNLRSLLVPTLLHLLAQPAIYGTAWRSGPPPPGSTPAIVAAAPHVTNSLTALNSDHAAAAPHAHMEATNTMQACSAAATAAAAMAEWAAGEPLFCRVLHVLAALLPGGLAPWLRGEHEHLKKLLVGATAVGCACVNCVCMCV